MKTRVGLNLCLAAALVGAGCASGTGGRRNPGTGTYIGARADLSDPAAVREELLRMVKAEQNVRARVFVPGTGEVDPTVVPVMQEIDEANRRRLKEIISWYGWPKSEWAGKDGVHAAFLIVQHAGLEWQMQMLPLIRESVERGDLEPRNLALLTDRLLVRQGMPQIYGTQFAVVNGRLMFEPIEDPENVDARRAELGLPSLEEYQRLVEQQLGLTAEP